MSYTRNFMGPGPFSVSIRSSAPDRPGLPESVRSRFDLGDYVFISPVRLDIDGLDTATIKAAMKAAGAFCGVLLEQPDPNTFAGQEFTWRLGTADGPGITIDTPIEKLGSVTLSTWLASLFPVDGISTGSVTNGTAIVNGATAPYATVASVLADLCEQSDTEWYAHADGTIDVGPSTTLFPSPTLTAATVITRRPRGREGGIAGVESTSMYRARDAAEVVSRFALLCDPVNGRRTVVTATQTPAGMHWVGLDGTPAEDRTSVGTAPGLKEAQAQKYADNLVARGSLDDREVVLTSRDHGVTGVIRQGSRVWVWELDNGILDLANQVPFGAGLMFPKQMRVTSITCSDTRRVYVWNATTDVWTDLSDWTERGDDSVSWVVTESGWHRNRAPIGHGTVVIDLSGGEGRAAFGRAMATVDTDTWTPVMGNVNVGTGGSAAAPSGTYEVRDGWMDIEAQATLGTTLSSIGGVITLDIPTGWELRGDYARDTNNNLLGWSSSKVAGTNRPLMVRRSTNTQLQLAAMNASGTYGSFTVTDASTPATWTAGDVPRFAVRIPVQRT